MSPAERASPALPGYWLGRPPWVPLLASAALSAPPLPSWVLSCPAKDACATNGVRASAGGKEAPWRGGSECPLPASNPRITHYLTHYLTNAAVSVRPTKQQADVLHLQPCAPPCTHFDLLELFATCYSQQRPSQLFSSPACLRTSLPGHHTLFFPAHSNKLATAMCTCPAAWAFWQICCRGSPACDPHIHLSTKTLDAERPCFRHAPPPCSPLLPANLAYICLTFSFRQWGAWLTLESQCETTAQYRIRRLSKAEERRGKGREAAEEAATTTKASNN